MRKFLFLLIFIVVIVPVHGGQEDVLTITHCSKVLNKEKTFQIYFPPSAKVGQKLPVLYVLHGAYGGYEDWIKRTNIEDMAENYEMILVFPDGSEFGWYLDSPVEKYSQYESYIVGELVPEIDRVFPTIGERSGRGIMGLSMGGHGAMLLTAKHADIFGSASSLSGILKLTDHPDKWSIPALLGPLGENREVWEANSVWDQAERFKNADVRLMFDCGTSDTATGAIYDSRKLHERLIELGIEHIWREMPGTHSWDYWQEHLGEHLNFHQASMVEATPNMGRWQKLYFERISEFLRENASIEIGPRAEKATVCLLGSSSMERFRKELLSEYKVYNRGISADILGIGGRGISHRLESSVFDMEPNYIFILNGRNDLGDRHRNGVPSIERMIEEYEKIVLEIRERLPRGGLYIITCPPTRGRYAHLAAAIPSYNKQLEILAKKHDIAVVDIYTELVGEDGLIVEKYTSDGLHLSDVGYEIMAQMMLNAMSGESAAVPVGK